MNTRPAVPPDLPAIAAIQATSPEASQWPPQAYLQYACRVAEVEGRVVAFLVTRETAPGEREILNLAVTAEFRRHGIARAMLREVLGTPGDWFLEVRESNAAAIALYRAMGFRVAGARPAYYIQPVEPGIVMRFRS